MNKLIEEKIKFNGKRLKVIEKTYENSEGNLYKRECVEPGDSALIMPINEKNEAIFIKQLREVIGKVELEFPAGIVDKDEKPEDAAKRELEEETGIVANNIEHLITVYPSCGYTNEKVHIFVAKDFSKGKVNLDEDEEILEIEKIPLDKCFELAKENYFEQATLNLAILMYYFKYIKK